MKHRTQKFMLPMLLAALCLILSGCWGNDPLSDADSLDGLIGAEGISSTDEEESPTAVTAFALPILSEETLNPYTCGDGIQQTILPLLYEGLFALDETFEPQNVLCSDYSVSTDFTVWTLTLRSGISFSDGSLLHADDVVASLQKARTSARYSARLSSVISVRAENDRTVVITLSEGNNRFLSLLDIPIVSKSSLNNEYPVGTGPYVYISSEDSEPFLMQNNNWWKEESLPLEKIELHIANDNSSLTYLFSSHEIQMLVTDYTGNDTTSYKGNLLVTDALTPTMQYIGFNCVNSIFSNADLRYAVSLGINRDGICQAYFSSHVQSAELPVAPSSIWYPKELELGYSAEAFKKAMTDAGYNEGHSVTVSMLVCDGNTFRLSAAKAIAAALSVYDLNVTIQTLPYAEYLAALQSGNFDLYYGEIRMTPDFNCSALVKTGGSLNYGGFSDPSLDAQISTAFSSASAPNSANETMLSKIQESAPIAVIGFKSQSVIIQGGVVDEITPTCSNSFYQLSNWKIHIKGEPSNG